MFLFMRVLCQTVVLLAGLFFLTAPVSSATGGIPVIASILPLGDFCEKIGGDRAAVQVLIPPGASPHVFEPSPMTVAKAMEARIIVYVGAGLDPWAERLVKTRGPGKLMTVEAVQGLPLLAGVARGYHKSASQASITQKPEEKSGVTEEHGHRQGNPHVWLDPLLAQDICRRIAQAFIRVDPGHKNEYEGNLAGYLAQLEDLHQEITRKVATFRQREYVCLHPAFAYFARRYGLKEVGVIEASPGREPSPGHLQEIITVIKNCGCRAVFAEPQLNPRVAQVIAREAGVKVLLLDPLGGRPPYGNDYLKLIRHNLAVLAEALQ